MFFLKEDEQLVKKDTASIVLHWHHFEALNKFVYFDPDKADELTVIKTDEAEVSDFLEVVKKHYEIYSIINIPEIQNFSTNVRKAYEIFDALYSGQPDAFLLKCTYANKDAYHLGLAQSCCILRYNTPIIVIPKTEAVYSTNVAVPAKSKRKQFRDPLPTED